VASVFGSTGPGVGGPNKGPRGCEEARFALQWRCDTESNRGARSPESDSMIVVRGHETMSDRPPGYQPVAFNRPASVALSQAELLDSPAASDRLRRGDKR
jgi:hypothetical protein